MEYFDKCCSLWAGTSDGAQEEEIKALFDMIDKDKSGSLSERVNITGDNHDWQEQIWKPEGTGKQGALLLLLSRLFVFTRVTQCHLDLWYNTAFKNDNHASKRVVEPWCYKWIGLDLRVGCGANTTAFKTGGKEGLQADQGSLWGWRGEHVIILEFDKDLIKRLEISFNVFIYGWRGKLVIILDFNNDFIQVKAKVSSNIIVFGRRGKHLIILDFNKDLMKWVTISSNIIIFGWRGKHVNIYSHLNSTI